MRQTFSQVVFYGTPSQRLISGGTPAPPPHPWPQAINWAVRVENHCFGLAR